MTQNIEKRDFEMRLGYSPDPLSFQSYTLREIIFNRLPHRNENSVVIIGHVGESVIRIPLGTLRTMITCLTARIKEKGLVKGDTVMLASFYSSNELANAILFAAFACLGIRICIPIYPEVNEFEAWHQATAFKAVIMPYLEILDQQGHEREKKAIQSFASLCDHLHIPFWDTFEDFGISSMLQEIMEDRFPPVSDPIFNDELHPGDDAVIFTTSGTTGMSKLVVYSQRSFSLSCQTWEKAGLFKQACCGNTGFTPLFTHTIGIRSFINALWTGHPVCIMVVDWFLHKPEVARYLLLQMQPGHIVGGPALFNMLLEFFRQYPELKATLRHTLKTAISIGAPFNTATAKQIKTALDLNLLNAFGTTETQMVLLNRNRGSDPEDAECLGSPLPGVVVGLKETDTSGVYALHIRSPYQASYIIGGSKQDPYFIAGDLVRVNAKGKLHFVQRAGSDFIKDDFGVKIPTSALPEYYPRLFEMSSHIEWIPLDHKPGLAALIFLKPSSPGMSSKEIREWVQYQNAQLQSTLQPFEFTHRHLERFMIERQDVPLTRKGSVSRKAILQQYGEVIKSLRNIYVADSQIESVESEEKSLMYTYSDSRLASMLEAMRMDVTFERGEKDTLYFSRNGKPVAVLDFVGGFGAGLLGHDHPAVKRAMHEFLDSGRPALNAQGSIYHYPALLASELNKIFGPPTGKYFKVQFGNSGAEAVEIALHHAYYEWWINLEKKRDEQLQLYGSLDEIDVSALWDQNLKVAAAEPGAIIVLNNCFHGYTSGPRSLLNHKKQRNFFSGLLRPLPLHVKDTDQHWREQIENYMNDQGFILKTVGKENGRYVFKQQKFSNIFAAIIEPVRGEGGIYETRTEIADYLSVQSFPLIADEIQCGLGRTGRLPAYPGAAYYLLGKSLGGGYEKISAVLIDDRRFKPTFPQYYTSTFANGEMAACASLTAIKEIQDKNYAAIAREKGDLFHRKLSQVAMRHPGVIESIEGKGLMLGVHFNQQVGKSNTLLRGLCESDLLGYLFAGWFFHQKNIRVLPSLSKPDAIRLEPSVHITPEQMDKFCEALDELCTLCHTGRMYDMLGYLMNDDPYLDRSEKIFDGRVPTSVEQPEPGALRVGLIGNFTNPPKELAFIESDLNKASDTGLRILFDKMQLLLEGKSVRLFSKNLMNEKIHFTFYILPFDTAHLEMIHRYGKKRYYIARIQETVNRMAAEGITHISLGAHTSILSGNGLYLAEPKNVKILTGNTMTVASCLFHIEQYYENASRSSKRPITIAIAGANGNIGSGLAGCLEDVKYEESQIMMVGTNLKKLERLRKEIFSPHRSVICTTDHFSLQQADIIISCTNSNDPLIFPHHIDPARKVFMIDIAVPGSVSEEVKGLDNVEFCEEASSAYMPDDPEFCISTHTPPGKIFCCAAESIAAALYDVQLPLKGHVRPESIKAMMELAVLEGMFQKKEYAAII